MTLDEKALARRLRALAEDLESDDSDDAAHDCNLAAAYLEAVNAEPVGYRVYDMSPARMPVKAKGKFPEPTEYFYPATRAHDARETARIMRGEVDALYTRPAPTHVTVKPLEWSQHPAGGEQALAAGLGLYRVHPNGDDWYLVTEHMGKGGKAAVQAHFEKSILSALDRHETPVRETQADLPITGETKLYIHGVSLAVAQSLVECFGGDETDMTVSYWKDGHSGPGFYCWCTEYPEDGSNFLGPASEYSYLAAAPTHGGSDA